MLSPYTRLTSCRVGALARRNYAIHAHRTPEAPSPELSQLLLSHAHRPPKPLKLSHLLAYPTRPVNADLVIQSVAHVQSELPRRLAARVNAIQALPYIVGTNPYIARMLEAYRKSFLWLVNQPKVQTLEGNAEFTEHLATLVEGHANDIPTIAKGCKESTKYMTPEVMTHFMDGTIRDRINIRLLAEEHIAISRALEEKGHVDDFLGVVHTKCSPAENIQLVGAFVTDLCEATLGASPRIRIDGHIDASFAYVPVHLQYIMTELLKNAFRATVEHHYKLYGEYSSAPIPPVQVTISPTPEPPTPARPSGAPYLSIRVRDQGGGVSASNMARIFSYAFTTAGARVGADSGDDYGGGPYAAQHHGGAGGADASMDSTSGGSLFSELAGKGLQSSLGTIAGLGYGLPMSRLYAKHFGGSLDLLSLDGWGSDCVIRLRTLDQVGDVDI